MNLKPLSLGLLALAAMVPAGEARAEAIITWQTPVTISADTDVLKTGTGGGIYFSLSSTSTDTVNTVTFVSSTAAPNVDLSAFDTAVATAGPSPFSGLSTAYKGILSLSKSASAGTASVVLASLTAGHTYRVQVWVNNSTLTTAETETISDGGNGSSAAISYNTTAKNGGLGQFIVGTFTANSSTETALFTPGGNYNALITAATLFDTTVAVPEPSSIALMGLGCVLGLGTLARRRTRRSLAC